MIDEFIFEFENNTLPCDRHRRYKEVLIRYKVIEPNVFRVQNIISFNPNYIVSFIRMVCKLADKHNVIISGKAVPTFVGPSVTKNDTFFIGMNQDRLLKFYQKFGFNVIEDSNGYQVTRSPK